MAQFLIILMLISGALSTWLAAVAWRRHPEQWALPFTLLMGIMANWALSGAIEFSVPALSMKMFWVNVQYFSIAPLPLVLVWFALAYTRRTKWLRRDLWLGAAVVPAITLLLAWTNLGELFRYGVVLEDTPVMPVVSISYGPWFWVHIGLTYASMIFVMALMVREAWRTTGQRRQQVRLLIVAGLVPFAGNFLTITKIIPIDITALAFSFSGFVMAWGLVRYRLFDIGLTARQLLINSMADGMVAINNNEQVVDVNEAAERIFGLPKVFLVGHNWRTLLKKQFDFHEPYTAVPDLAGHELCAITAAGDFCYDLRLSPIYIQPDNEQQGWLILLRDITARRQMEQAVQNQKELFEQLVEIARAANRGVSLKHTLRNILHVCAGLTHAEHGSLFVLDEYGRPTSNVILGEERPTADHEQIIGRVLQTGLAHWVARSQQTVRLADAPQDERWLALESDRRASHSVLCVPIVYQSITLGVLTLTHGGINCFTLAHQQLLEAASEQIALALNNARYYEQAREQAHNLDVLYTATRQMGQQEDLAGENNALHTALRAALILTGFDMGLISLVNEAGVLHIHTQQNMAPFLAADYRQQDLSGSLCEHTFHQQEVVHVMDTASADPPLPPHLLAGLQNLAAVSYLGLPLMHQGEVLGTLCLFGRKPKPIPHNILVLNNSLAQQISQLLVSQRLWVANLRERSRLQTVIEASREGLVLVSPSLELMLINPQALRLLHLTGTVESWQGQSMIRALHHLHQRDPQAAQKILQTVRNKRNQLALRPQGELQVGTRYVQWRAVPMNTAAEQLGHLVVLYDVTDERAVQDLRETMTRTMVHDLRNPIGSAYTAASFLREILEETAESDENLKLFNSIQHSLQRALRLINDILDLNRLESGRMPLDMQPFSLNELLDITIMQQETLAQAKNIRLVLDAPEELPIVVADYGLIERTLQNLVSNAVKFTPHNGRVTLRAQVHRQHSQPQLLVSVVDSGTGVPDYILPRLFGKFIKGDQHESGSGLGLAFCKMVLDAHGERIWLESPTAESPGAHFSFTLPILPHHIPHPNSQPVYEFAEMG